ncbi:GNAT family N-acetyltransferase [Microvirga terricola]|uniref:N-acetyltransferase n=1 Tax=Microvirga terricola TaxID=2719797 RepID=A0ABX0VCM1_9HYPH|nr:N-acetyltransferase [Microvirga terricola]NIX76111.1 N-acetyltransferase [Microvirga terricola]
MTSSLRIRIEESTDRAAIRAIHAAAFGGNAEADLVDRLRADGDLTLSLVACASDDVVGHIAFSPLALADCPSVKACALAPVAVLPPFQNRGIGAALIEDALQRLADADMDLVLVLGEPDYYGDFSFRVEAAEGLKTPYDGPYLQALPLSENGRTASGPVVYARAFAELT